MKSALALSALLLAIAPAARAQWMPTGAPVVTANTTQYNAAIAPDGAGGCYVAWLDFRSGSFDVYAHHLLSDGRRDPAWPADGVAVCNASGEQDRVVVIADGAGGAFVSWLDPRSGTTYGYAQRLRPAGVDPAWPVNGRLLSSAYPSLNKEVQLAPDGAGGVYALLPQLHAVTDYRVQHVVGTGALDPNFGTGLLVGTANFTGGRFEHITSDGAGGALVAFLGADFGVNVQRARPDGTLSPTWPAGGRRVTAPGTAGSFPVAVADGAGGAIVVWGHTVGSEVDIRAQHVTAAGALDPAWPDTGAVVCDAPSYQQTSFAASDGAGGVFVAWSDMRTGNQFDVYAHHLFANGSRDATWPVQGTPVATRGGGESARAVSADGAGGVVVLWHDSGSDQRGPHAQRLNASGAVAAGWPADGAWLSGLSNATTLYGYAADPASHDVFVAWDEFRLGTSHVRDRDVYARRVPVGAMHRITTTQDTPGGYVMVPDSLSIYWSPSLALYTLDVTPLDRIEYRFPSHASQSVLDVTANGVSLGAAPNHVLSGVTQDIALHAAWTHSLLSVSNDLADGVWQSLAWPMTYTNDSLSTLFDELVPSDDRKWRFAHWDPIAGAYAYATDTLQRIRPGAGYWLTSRAARTVAVAGRPTWQARTVLPLVGGAASGWNQVANPYRFPIADTALRVVSGASTYALTDPANTYTDSTVWEWTGGSSYTRARTLQPYRAYWVRKRVDAAVSLEFPGLTSTGPALVPPAPAPSAEWALALTLSQGSARTEPVFAGTRRGAGDVLVTWAPPCSPEGGLRLAIGAADAVRPGAQAFYADAGGAPPAWTLELSGAAGTNGAELELAGFGLPPATSFVLTDPATGWSRELRAGDRMSLALTAAPRRFALAVAGAPLPEATGARVFAAWPNPFRGRLAFVAQLANPGRLRVEVMDVQGRLVRAIERADLAAGEHVIAWDGRDAAGAPTRPGVYLARWCAGGRTGGARIVKLD